MSKYNRSTLDAYKHLNSGCNTDMEEIARIALSENYGVHRLLSAIYRHSVNYDGCANDDEVRRMIKETVSLL